jgi:hypothetical protein
MSETWSSGGALGFLTNPNFCLMTSSGIPARSATSAAVRKLSGMKTPSRRMPTGG